MTRPQHCSMMLLPLAALLSCPSLGQAQEEAIFKRATNKQVEDILEKLKIPVKQSSMQNTRSFYSMTLEGYKVVLINHGSSLQFTAGFRTSSGGSVPLERINEWNRTKRHSRAFLDRNGDGVLEADLDFYGGTTERSISEWINLYKVSVSEFAKFTQ